MQKLKFKKTAKDQYVATHKGVQIELYKLGVRSWKITYGEWKEPDYFSDTVETLADAKKTAQEHVDHISKPKVKIAQEVKDLVSSDISDYISYED